MVLEEDQNKEVTNLLESNIEYKITCYMIFSFVSSVL